MEQRKMKTFDLRTLQKDLSFQKWMGMQVVRPIDPDLQSIALKRWTWKELNDYRYFLATPDRPVMSELSETKSLHYVSHSHHFGIVGPPLLQLSLAICLRLYSVSHAIECHRDFAGKYLIELPDMKFVKQLIVPI